MKIYHETFRSPANQPSKEDAEYVLNSIRKCHPASSGWVELNGYVEKAPNDFGSIGWRAVCELAKYS